MPNINCSPPSCKRSFDAGEIPADFDPEQGPIIAVHWLGLVSPKGRLTRELMAHDSDTAIGHGDQA